MTDEVPCEYAETAERRKDSEADRSYRGLRVWNSAADLAAFIYRSTDAWPPEERYGMTSQIRRAAVSVVANIAEGWGRQGPGDFIRFLWIAHGSLKELEAIAEVARRVGFATANWNTDVQTRTKQTGTMLRALVKAVEKRRAPVVREQGSTYITCVAADKPNDLNWAFQADDVNEYFENP
jgi:four helix bundle protein